MSLAFRDEIPFEFVASLLRYEPTTGRLIWRVNRGPVMSGMTAGTVDQMSGCINIGVTYEGAKYVYKAHRLAWLLHTGNWPTDMIDHKDLDRANNRWKNLRQATRPQNCSNSRARSTHKKGAYFRASTGRWNAQIRVNNKTLSLGTFSTESEAHKAYCKAAVQIRGEFARTE